jgi:FkbM family methyltransferase
MQLVGDMYIPDGDYHFIKLGDSIGDYQKPQRLKALEYVTSWHCAVDLGAHVGIFSRHFAGHFDQVVAFEPTSETRLCLEKNVPSNVIIIPCAAGDREGPVTFRRHIKNSGASEIALKGRPDSGGFEQFVARMVTLDSLDLQRVGLVKIDVQGAELIALRGAAGTLGRWKPVVLIEEKPLKGKDADASMERISECRDFLLDCGYRQGEKVGADRIYLAA